jgi:hypothetical protein
MKIKPQQTISFRVLPSDLRMVKELRQQMGVSKTAIMRLAIRSLYRKEMKIDANR